LAIKVPENSETIHGTHKALPANSVHIDGNDHALRQTMHLLSAIKRTVWTELRYTLVETGVCAGSVITMFENVTTPLVRKVLLTMVEGDGSMAAQNKGHRGSFQVEMDTTTKGINALWASSYSNTRFPCWSKTSTFDRGEKVKVKSEK
jgi:hypothetical protein